MLILASFMEISLSHSGFGADLDAFYIYLDDIQKTLLATPEESYKMMVAIKCDIQGNKMNINALNEIAVKYDLEKAENLVLRWCLGLRQIMVSGYMDRNGIDKGDYHCGFEVVPEDVYPPLTIIKDNTEAVYVPPPPTVAKESVIKSQTKSANKTHLNNKKAREAFEKDAREKATITSNEAEAKRVAKLRAKAKAVAGKK